MTFYQSRHILRQRGGNVYYFMRHGLGEAHLAAVERLPFDCRHIPAVHIVAAQWESQIRHVHAYLMSAPGFKGHAEQSSPGVPADRLKMRDRWFSLRSYAPPDYAFALPADGDVYRVPGRDAVRYRKVRLLQRIRQS